MSTLAARIPPSRTRPKTLAELLDRLGNVPPERVRADPPPGTATERDVIDVEAREDRLCELVDGTLVEKAMGYRESLIAAVLIELLGPIVRSGNLGLLTGPDGTVRLFAGMVRIPDVAFVSWDRVPGRRVPDAAIPDLVPDLAVEVLSESNTSGEIARKLNDYFAAGVRLVWLVEPRGRKVTVYTSARQLTELGESELLNGGDVIPSLTIPVRELFLPLEQQG